ncbi:MAG: fibronectin type III domain-containing protein [Aequorivita sp.]|nr:fibronectin type III domain-containing protein [Aequorivita sp.]
MKYKLLIYTFLVTMLVGCSKDGSDDNTSFTFQVEVQNVTDRAATVIWTRPEGSNITYQVYLNDELIESSYRQNTYTFTGLLSETSYSGKITATNGSETTTVGFAFNTEDYVPNIYESGAYLNNQQAVNEFGSHHYNEIRYNLIITGPEIYDLTPLNDLKKVHGTIEIEHTIVQTFEGLDNLEFIGEDFDIHYNPNLVDLNSLQKLTHIGNDLIFYSNPILENVNGLSNVSLFTGAFQLEGSKIESLNILNDATQLKNIYIGLNPELRSITGFQNVTKIDDFFEVHDNPSLNTLSGLSSITEINGQGFFIDLNTSLDSIELINLTSLGDQVFIFENGAITNLDCFYNVIGTVRDIWISNQNMLGDFCGISNTVLSSSGTLTVEGNLYNPTLEDFQNGNCSL